MALASVKVIVFASFHFATLFANAESTNETFFFLEEDGKNHTILYRADCLIRKEFPQCRLQAVSVRNSRSQPSCSIDVSQLYFGEALKTNDGWTISSTAGLCDYTNVYTISKDGMVQLKTSPRKKRMEQCEVFEPKTYKMKYYKYSALIDLGVAGCSSMKVLGL